MAFEKFIWYFKDKPCVYCSNCYECGYNPVDGDESCMTKRLVRIVFYGNGDCWEGKKRNDA